MSPLIHHQATTGNIARSSEVSHNSERHLGTFLGEPTNSPNPPLAASLGCPYRAGPILLF